MSADMHTCSYSCQRPACVLAQRDELAQRAEQDAAEIVRLRGEVAELKARRSEDVSILDDIRDAIGGGPYDTIAKRIRQDIAPAEAKNPAPAMPNGVEVGPLDLSAPPRVFLQVDTDGDNEDRSESIPREAWGDLTWYHERIGGQEVEYVRKDLIRAADNRDPAGVEESAALYGMFRALVDAGGATNVARYGGEKRAKALADALQRGMFAIEHRFHPERFDEFPVGALAPAAVPAGEAVAINYAVVHRFATENDVDYNRLAKLVRDSIYTTPPAPVQAAPQEGEGPWLGEALRFLGELESVGNLRAGEVARGLRRHAAHPSACELGAVRDLLAEAAASVDASSVGDGISEKRRMYRIELASRLREAAIQHRGDSRGGEGS